MSTRFQSDTGGDTGPTVASSLLKFIREHPPLGGVRSHTQVDTVPNGSIRDTTLVEPQTTARHWKPSNEVTYEAYKQQVLLNSLRLKSTFLFRALGSTLAVSSRHAVAILLLIPLITKVIALALRGFAFHTFMLSYTLAALATALHLYFLPICSICLVDHSRRFETRRQMFRRHLLKPLAQMTLLVYARAFVSFLFTLSALMGFKVSLVNILTFALLGVVLLGYQISYESYLIDWDALVTRKRSSKITLRAADLVVPFLCVANAVLLASWFGSSWKLEPLRYGLLILLAPFPAIGIPLEPQGYSLKRILLLELITLCSVWFASWVMAVIAAFQEAKFSVLIGNHKDLLLAANGRSWLEQFAFLTHILTPLEDASNNLPLTSAVAFVGSEFQSSGYLEQTTRGSNSGHVCLVPTVPSNTVPVFTNELKARNFPNLPRQRLSMASDLKNLPVAAASALLTPLVTGCLTSEWQSALTVIASQNAHRSFLARSFCLASDPTMFGPASVWNLSESQILRLSGARRRGFYSNQERQILSCEAGAIIFGDQIYAALVSRALSLVKALQSFVTSTDLLMSTPPTGVMRSDAPTPGAVPTLRRQAKAALFRFENSFLINLEIGVDFLLGNEANNPLRIFLNANRWRRFGDGSIGIEPHDRALLLKACEACLYANLTLFRMAMQALENIVRVRQHFFSDSTDVKLSAGSDPSSKLRKHYPHLSNNEHVRRVTADPAPAGATSASLRRIVAHALPLKKLLKSFAELPLDPPLCVPRSHIQIMCKNIVDRIDQWLRALEPNPESVEPVHLLNVVKAASQRSKQI